MKILCVYTNITGFHSDTYHFGLASVIAATREADHDLRAVIVHTMDDYNRVYDELEAFDPDIVAFTSVSSQFHFVTQISEGIKSRRPDTIVVCGGTHTTIYPDCIVETDSLDGIFVGECEQAFPQFVGMVENGEDYHSCPNFAYNKDGELVRNPQIPLVKNLDELPFPDKTVYPYLETVELCGTAPFFFSRGCPFTCTYCSNHAIARANGMPKSITRYRSPESSICEIEAVLKEFPQIKALDIADDIFGINKKWRREFLKLYVERINMPFMCLLRADVITDEFLTMLKEAGCFWIQLGLESGNEYIRNEVMGRNMSQELIIKACDMIADHGMKASTLNIIGAPGETEEMLWDTINLNRRIKPANSGVNIFYPYKGTALGDKCFEEGLVDLERFENFSNERRESVLKYDEEWQKKLVWYHANWERLIYPTNVKLQLRHYLGDTPIWPILKAAKRVVNSIRN
jgi:radical SAM superfamily enzyme YgiQ (UPF0313 family)